MRDLLSTKVKVYKDNKIQSHFLEILLNPYKFRSIFSLKLLFVPSLCQTSTVLVRFPVMGGPGSGPRANTCPTAEPTEAGVLGTHNLILISLWRRTQRATTTIRAEPGSAQMEAY